MTTIVRCPRTGRACSEGACRERHWCRQLFERGLSHRGLPLKRKFRPRCCAKTRAGAPCIMRVVPGKRRCRFRPDSRSAATALEGISRCCEAFSVSGLLGGASVSPRGPRGISFSFLCRICEPLIIRRDVQQLLLSLVQTHFDGQISELLRAFAPVLTIAKVR